MRKIWLEWKTKWMRIINSLYDGYKQSIEGINELKDDVKELKGKVENREYIYK